LNINKQRLKITIIKPQRIILGAIIIKKEKTIVIIFDNQEKNQEIAGTNANNNAGIIIYLNFNQKGR